MPIVGLTTNRTAHMGRLGVLRKGGEKPNEKQPGPDLKHFRFDGKGDKELEEAFARAYGTEPTHIRIFLPYATLDENFQAWREEYGKSGIKHRCDGETIWERDQNNVLYKTAKPCPGGCQRTSRLSVIIPDLIIQAKRVGETTIITSSKYDIYRLVDNLLYYESISGGDLRGIPFVIFRREEVVPLSYVGKNGEIIKTRGPKWLINLEPAPEYVERRLEVIRRHALNAGMDSLPALTDSEHEQDDDDTIEAEYQHVNPDTGEIAESEEANDDLYAACTEAASQGIAYDFSGSTSEQIYQHITLWRRFVDVVIPAALEVGVLRSVDYSRYSSLSYDELKNSALKAVELIKNKMLETLGEEAPQSTKIEDWLTAWREVFTRKPDF